MTTMMQLGANRMVVLEASDSHESSAARRHLPIERVPATVSDAARRRVENRHRLDRLSESDLVLSIALDRMIAAIEKQG